MAGTICNAGRYRIGKKVRGGTAWLGKLADDGKGGTRFEPLLTPFPTRKAAKRKAAGLFGRKRARVSGGPRGKLIAPPV
jgi:hypothetical protein